jgi:hypothetical protein
MSTLSEALERNLRAVLKQPEPLPKAPVAPKNPSIRRSASLFYNKGPSDKVYHIQIVDSSLNNMLYYVNFQYGRRVGTLKGGTKTDRPVPIHEAELLFYKLLNEKLGKGYEWAA